MNDTCTSLREALLDRADGRATAEQRATVEAHLAGCAACRELAAKLGTPLPEVGRVEIPAALMSGMRAELSARLDAMQPRAAREREEAPHGWLSWLFTGSLAVPKPFAWAAVALLIAFWAGRGVTPTAIHHAPAPTPVLMDGVDRLGASESASEG